MGTCPRHILGRFFCGDFFGIKCASRDVNDGTSHGTTHHKSANSSANIPHGALIAGKLFSNYHLPLFLTCIAFDQSARSSFFRFADLFVIGLWNLNRFNVEELDPDTIFLEYFV